MVEGFVRADARGDRGARSTPASSTPLDAPEVARALVRMLNGYLDDALGRRRSADPERVLDAVWTIWTRTLFPCARGDRSLRCAPLWPGAWPAEDGGPRRTQAAAAAGSASAPASACEVDRAARRARRRRWSSCATRARSTSLRHTLGRRPLRDPHDAWVERVDPLTLEPLARSPRPAGRPVLAGRHGGARQRLAARRHRQPLPPALAGARAARARARLPGRRARTTRSSSSPTARS